MTRITRQSIDLPARLEKHIVIVANGKTAVEHLAENTPLSKQRLKQVMSCGCVWLESAMGIHRLRRAKKILNSEDILHLYYDAAIVDSKPPAASLIADENAYSIWNKPCGLYSQGTRWGDHFTIYRQAEQRLRPQRPAFPVHRLDRAASGLIILAHSKKTAAAFAEMFQNRSILKRYRATVAGTLHCEKLPFPLSTDIEGKPAVSKIIALQTTDPDRTIVTMEIETGRKHQIRKHLSGIGFPIIGDRLYGSGQTEENLQLQSTYLRFTCPLSGSLREYKLTDTMPTIREQ